MGLIEDNISVVQGGQDDLRMGWGGQTEMLLYKPATLLRGIIKKLEV